MVRRCPAAKEQGSICFRNNRYPREAQADVVNFVYKSPNAPAIESTFDAGDDQIKALQGVVEGHIKLIVLASDSAYRITLVCRDSPVDDLARNVTIGDATISGPVGLFKYGPGAKPVSMDRVEIEEWSRFLDEASKPVQQTEKPADPPPAMSPEGVSVIVTPVQDGQSPEDAVAETVNQVGVQWSHISPSSEGATQLYAAALETIRMQGHQFELVDEKNFKIRIEGRDGIVEKYVRLIEIEASPQISSHEQLAELYGIKPEGDWHRTLSDRIAAEHDLWLSLVDGGIEVGFFSGDEKDVGYPLQYPFTVDDWAMLANVREHG